MKKLINNLKDPITDLIGLAIVVATLYDIYAGEGTWIWEGLTGVGVGLALFMLPDAMLMDSLGKIFNRFIDNKPKEE